MHPTGSFLFSQTPDVPQTGQPFAVHAVPSYSSNALSPFTVRLPRYCSPEFRLRGFWPVPDGAEKSICFPDTIIWERTESGQAYALPDGAQGKEGKEKQLPHTFSTTLRYQACRRKPSARFCAVSRCRILHERSRASSFHHRSGGLQLP